MWPTPKAWLVTLVLLAPAAWTAAAAGAPDAVGQKTIASYCSSSGDVCYGVFKRSGKVYLRITTAARYFRFPVFRQGGGTWGSSVNYLRQYPIRTAGRYRVTWKLGATPFGPSLHFRLALI